MTAQLRHLALFSQGLGAQPLFGEGVSGTRCAIEHLGYVQVDTLSVVERAHHHVLWCRVPHYTADHLNSLTHTKHIFEYWYHAAAYLPMRDYRYALPHMISVRDGGNQYFNKGDPRLMSEILARIKIDGSMRLRDMDTGNAEKKGTWWHNGAARRAMEQLFMQGDVMVCERDGMEKIYAITENCLPSNLDLSVPTLSDYALYLFNTTLRAHGVFTWQQLLHLKTGKRIRDAMRTVLNDQLGAGVIIALDNINGQTLYVSTDTLEQTALMPSGVKILSPFDNLVIHRDRLSSLFEFEYRLECYIPASKRVFGYFCLPIVFDGRLVGRMDCKAHRAAQRLEVLSLHLEHVALDKEQLLLGLRHELQQFAAFNACTVLDAAVIDAL